MKFIAQKSTAVKIPPPKLKPANNLCLLRQLKKIHNPTTRANPPRPEEMVKTAIKTISGAKIRKTLFLIQFIFAATKSSEKLTLK